jgi:hypothetical protein
VFSALKWRARLFLPLIFLYKRLFPDKSSALVKLSFIHFARWTILKRIPHNEGQPRDDVHYRHLFFESNFNGGWEEYIDAFSHILTDGMKKLWGTSYGFPQPLPTARFKRYIKRNEIDASHFYSAYPEATATIVNDALALDGDLERFKKTACDLPPDEFADAWRAFLTKAQAHL